MSTIADKKPNKPSKTKPLTHKELVFCYEYNIDGNGARAAAAARYAKNSARQTAVKLLSKAYIMEKVEELREAKLARATKSADDVIRELEAIGFSRITDVIKWDKKGKTLLRDSEELSSEVAAAIESIQITETQSGKGNDVCKVLKSKIKLHNKIASLTALAKHHNLLSENARDSVESPITVKIIDYSRATQK